MHYVKDLMQPVAFVKDLEHPTNAIIAYYTDILHIRKISNLDTAPGVPNLLHLEHLPLSEGL